MSIFDVCLIRLHCDRGGGDALHLTVEWPCLPRAGEGLDIARDMDAVTVESVGYNLDGHPTVYGGRVVLDDIQLAQLRKAGRADDRHAASRLGGQRPRCPRWQRR
jgi:hypothetical protein